ncbi:putative guanine nucleotide exchange factor lte1 protein [Colletotrichum sp. SAR 10_70]|nr:putative guanine nucleotide exchange factor lte1 protein [Colletotrichum sp. SAR 10_70]
MEATEPLSSPAGRGFSVRSPQSPHSPRSTHRDQPPQSPLSPRSPIFSSARFGKPPKSAGGKEGSGAITGGKWTSKMRMPGASAKPLVPVTEKKSEEWNLNQSPARRLRADSSADDNKFDITPDGGSAGREGRQFTVANVGNNGRIYLRRAHSDSTAHDGATSRNSEAEGFKIIISKPGEEKRSKTTEDLDAPDIPLLDIEIPSWKLGNPRFTARGTAFFRGSSYAPTEEFPRSSNVSFLHRTPTGELTPRIPESFSSRKPTPISIPQIRLPPLESTGPAVSFSPAPMTTPRLPPIRSTYLSTHLVIEPAMFDALTFKPACDDRSLVRYSPSTGAVTAATPPRLVAEITSPSFLDYELISDFFLTYRAFLEPADLLRMLLARLRWALGRDDEIGMVVRVRTFVAMRHWILNYFIDDFVIEYALRVTFCNLLNDMVDELSTDPRGRKVQLKILAELKKCWRRVCAQFWDGPEFDSSLGPNVPIAPGGIAGHRNASLDPSFWEQDGAAPQLDSLFVPIIEDKEQASFYADVSRAGHFGDSQPILERPSTPENQNVQEFDRTQAASPTSIVSMDVISCSFPGKTTRGAQPAGNTTLGAHPVAPSSSVYSSAGPVATTPRALVGKRVRPSHGHKRSGSLTDSLREKQHAAEKTIFQETEFLMSLPFAGSLVRGNLMPPGQPYVEMMSPSLSGENQRQTTLFQVPPEHRSTASAMSGQGMRKLIGSVRRALSTRGQNVSPTQGNFINISPIGPRGATTNRLPGTAIVPQAQPRLNGTRPPVRLDLLGAEIVEDFKKAVREDAAVEAAADAERRGYLNPTIGALHSALPDGALDYSAAHITSAFGSSIHDNDTLRPVSDMAITTGSKSIVIVDDTVTSPLPAMHGAIPVNDSVEAFADSFMPPAADPTPPNTPPGHLMVKSFDATTYSENSGSDEDEPSPVPEPLRILRRRPGGDLRAVNNVGDLDAFPLRKSRSVGSLTTYSESMRSSYLQSSNHDTSAFVDVVSSEFSHQDNAETFSLGALAEPSAKRQVSLFSTHSSKPIMRPSFEAEAQKLAQIPDDADDDGGVESALLKLEGKYEKRTFKLSMEPANTPLPGVIAEMVAKNDMEGSPKQGRQNRHLHVLPGDAIPTHQHPEGPDSHASFLDIPQRPPTETGSFLSEKSGESYCSIPLLERDFSDDGQSKASVREWTNMSILQGPDDDITPAVTPRPMEDTGSHHSSYEFVRKTESMEKIKSGDTKAPPSEQSFLEDDSDGEDDNVSDLSSELSAEVVEADEFVAPKPQAPKSHRSASILEFNPRPLRESVVSPVDSQNPPSPPMTLVQALRMSPEAAMIPELRESQVFQRKPLPLTPDATPTDALYLNSPADPTGTREALRGQPKIPEEERESSLRFSVHLPFILAFDSEILAQQFTLIEKDALNEIDWKELIEMGWKNATNNDSRSWVDFLRNTDAHGVEVVIARFNIMVKWACSEIVLTQNIEERARCIIKFIHIAAHCRRYRNFATMSQITIALTSMEVSRLTRTWAMVPPYDMKTLQELEGLISPTRNFYNLRAEMEGGSDDGCIPFVGIYTHDLLFNAQRPSEIASSPTTAPLVNFERCRYSATIVKTLLRLLEASTLYEFQPVEGITERCLWMSALSDEEIRKHSHRLE